VVVTFRKVLRAPIVPAVFPLPVARETFRIETVWSGHVRIIITTYSKQFFFKNRILIF